MVSYTAHLLCASSSPLIRLFFFKSDFIAGILLAQWTSLLTGNSLMRGSAVLREGACMQVEFIRARGDACALALVKRMMKGCDECILPEHVMTVWFSQTFRRVRGTCLARKSSAAPARAETVQSVPSLRSGRGIGSNTSHNHNTVGVCIKSLQISVLALCQNRLNCSCVALLTNNCSILQLYADDLAATLS